MESCPLRGQTRRTHVPPWHLGKTSIVWCSLWSSVNLRHVFYRKIAMTSCHTNLNLLPISGVSLCPAYIGQEVMNQTVYCDVTYPEKEVSPDLVLFLKQMLEKKSGPRLFLDRRKNTKMTKMTHDKRRCGRLRSSKKKSHNLGPRSRKRPSARQSFDGLRDIASSQSLKSAAFKISLAGLVELGHMEANQIEQLFWTIFRTKWVGLDFCFWIMG